MDIAVELAFDAIKIKFGGVLHLRIQRSKLLGIASWRYGEKNYAIEYTMAGGTVLCEYDSEEKWKTILGKLDAIM